MRILKWMYFSGSVSGVLLAMAKNKIKQTQTQPIQPVWKWNRVHKQMQTNIKQATASTLAHKMMEVLEMIHDDGDGDDGDVGGSNDVFHEREVVEVISIVVWKLGRLLWPHYYSNLSLSFRVALASQGLSSFPLLLGAASIRSNGVPCRPCKSHGRRTAAILRLCVLCWASHT